MLSGKTERGLVIVPAFNEAEVLAKTVAELRSGLPDVDLLIVNDGSTDETVRVAGELVVDIVSHGRNIGYHEALRTGGEVAAKEERPFVCFFDADGQHRVQDLAHMLAFYHERLAQDEAVDLIVGSRYLDSGGRPTSLLRGLGNRIFCYLVYHLTGRRFTDISNGLKVLSRRALTHMLAIPLEDAHAELLLSALQKGYRVEEISVQILPRKTGTSMITATKAVWYPLRTLLAITLMYSFRPQVGRRSSC